MSIHSDSYSARRSVAAIEEQRRQREECTPCLRVIERTETEMEEHPLLQQIALLGMMKSTLARGVARRIASNEDCQDRPSFHDYRALVAHGFAYKAEDERWHTLTPEGWIYARAMLKRLCVEHDIHVMTQTHGKDATYFKCSCGGWSTTLYGKPGLHQLRRAQQRFYAHLPAEMKWAESA